MALFIFAGALIRQFFVLMHQGSIQPAYPGVGVALILLAVWLAAPSNDSDAAAPAQASVDSSVTQGDVSMDDDAQGVAADSEPGFEEIHRIIDDRCTQCHAQNPSHAGFASAPSGVMFDTVKQIKIQKDQIQQVVASGYMPLGNITKITDEERAEIAAW
jgi:uncharacterized membrane protein